MVERSYACVKHRRRRFDSPSRSNLYDTMTNYKTFDYTYDAASLLSLYNTLKAEGKYQSTECFNTVYLTDVPHDIFPKMNIFGRLLDSNEYGLAEITADTGYHVNPGNNGLIIFPIEGVINFTFENDDSIDITQPTITNGKVSHTYSPKSDSAIFFAIKIPFDIDINIVYEQISVLS